MDDSPIFKSEGLFPDRFDFKAKLIKPELEFMSIIDKMEFITNMAYWSAYFKSGIIGISDKDWKTISDAAFKENVASAQ